MVNYFGSKVVIVGLGYTAISCINFFYRKGVTPRVMDTRVNPPNIDKLSTNIKYWLGGLNIDWLLNSTMIIVSPGVNINNPELIKAANAGIEIIGDIELFVREVTVPIIAITGSNGKSTVTSMLGSMCIDAGYNVGIGGNIGLPVLDLLDKSYELYILELSSFQLETTKSLYTVASTILNICEDHMDRYPQGIQQYCNAKYKIYNHTSCCIFNAEDKLTYPLFYNQHIRYISFGSKHGDYKLNTFNNSSWLTAYGKLLLNCNEMKINGLHNYMNALAALALSEILLLPLSKCLQSLCKFNGLPHRFELVYENNGVQWINDSKATNVGSTKAALSNLKILGTLHILLGGDGKNADFSPLIQFLKNEKIKVYCFGKDRVKLAALTPQTSIIRETMEEVMLIMVNNLNKGDIVLLSPACASLKQFPSFEERGNFFTKLAKKIG